MQKNEGATDRLIRGFLSIVVLYFTFSNLAGVPALLGYMFGTILLFTAVTGSCYLYSLLGINTKKQ